MNIYKLSLMIFILFSTIFIFLACSEKNPVDDDHSEHAEAMGLIVFSPSDTLFTYKQGAVYGKLQLKSGESTPLLTVQFIDEAGDYFTLDGPEHTFEYEIANSSIIQVDDAPGGEWQFIIKAIAVGNTTFIIKIFHEGHSDFVSAPLPVEISQ